MSIFLQQKKAIRAISSASHNAHTEPLFKIYNILKLKDIFNYNRLLTFYYNLRHNKVPHYIATFLPNTSIAVNRSLLDRRDYNRLCMYMNTSPKNMQTYM